MGVFADAMTDAADQQSTTADTGTSAASGADSSPESTAAPSGTAPTTPKPPADGSPSPFGARTPQGPQRQGAVSEGNKQVDLRALQEARSQNKALRDTYSWLPREEAGAYKTFYSEYKRDPVATLMGELEAFVSQPQARERIAHVLQSWGFTSQGGSDGRGASKAAFTGQHSYADDDPEPGPDFKLGDGTPFMSAGRLAEWRSWHARQDEKRFDERLAPIQQFVSAAQQASVRAAAVQNANSFAERVFSEAKAWPHFTENQAAIGTKYQEFSSRMSAEAALYRAYLAVMHEQVLPSLSRQERTAVASELQQRGKATTPNPTRAPGTRGDRRPESFRDAAERVLSNRAS